MKTNNTKPFAQGLAVSSDIHRAICKWSNSIFRPTIPTNLIDKCVVTEISDERAKLLTAQFLYGERKGEEKEVPYDDGEIGNRINDLSIETLWLYGGDGLSLAPKGFDEKSLKDFQISTGKTRKCSECRGSGKITCSKCKGTRYYTEKDNDGRTKSISCSCGDGKERCDDCDGYGKVQIVIEIETEFKVELCRKQDYQGKIPKKKLDKSTGRVIFEESVDYPKDKMTVMLQGGINPDEYAKLQDNVSVLFHSLIEKKLTGYDGDIRLVHSLVDGFLKAMPNACKQNKLLRHEILPVRLGFKIEDAPVKKVSYTYKDAPYELWVYGNEKKVFSEKRPAGFTIRLVIEIVFAIGLLFLIFS